MKKILLVIIVVIGFILPKNVLANTMTVVEDGKLEGCTGYMAVKDKIYSSIKNKKKYEYLKVGTPFVILNEEKGYFYIDTGYNKGYVKQDYVMINLSDYIPSIIYNITNASSSIYVSSGEFIPNITGEKLYKSDKIYNERLKKEEYIVPVMYSFAKKILKAQKSALKDGYTLKIYDAYRPHSVTKKIYSGLSSLYKTNSKVKNNIKKSITNKSSWGTSWFLAKNVSTHNTGSAIDVTLARIDTLEELDMPTNMHELSTKAIKYKSSSSKSYSKEMKSHPDAIYLDKLMKSSGMQTLASEWWHFQDNSSHRRIKSKNSSGCNFQPTILMSY